MSKDISELSPVDQYFAYEEELREQAELDLKRSPQLNIPDWGMAQPGAWTAYGFNNMPIVTSSTTTTYAAIPVTSVSNVTNATWLHFTGSANTSVTGNGGAGNTGGL